MNSNKILLNFLLFLGILSLPTFALFKISKNFDNYFLIAIPIFISFISYFLCYHDKKKATKNNWRIPENSLHLFELLGGWPGSFIAQKIFRHKTNKWQYQLKFWLIITFYQLFSWDVIQNFNWLKSFFGN